MPCLPQRFVVPAPELWKPGMRRRSLARCFLSLGPWTRR